MSAGARLRLAVHKFASCDGCQLQLFNLEEELLPLADRLEIAHFPEASRRSSPPPWDVSLIEGSITTARDAEQLERIREESAVLVAIGACATSGGVQALRNTADAEAWLAEVYPEPVGLDVLPTSTPASAHVPVDHELFGCPPSRGQLLRLLLRELLGAAPDVPGSSVCLECKRAGHACVLVTRGLPCMGPVTRSGCGALCPALGRDCYACFGPSDDPNPRALVERFRSLGLSSREIRLRFAGVTAGAEAFRRAAEALEGDG